MQVDRSNRERRRKGISLTPRKQEQQPEKVASVGKEPAIQLAQSVVDAAESTAPVRTTCFGSAAPYRPNVVFSYSNASSQQQQQASGQLDRQIQQLQQQIVDKKQAIAQSKKSPPKVAQKKPFSAAKFSSYEMAQVEEVQSRVVEKQSPKKAVSPRREPPKKFERVHSPPPKQLPRKESPPKKLDRVQSQPKKEEQKRESKTPPRKKQEASEFSGEPTLVEKENDQASKMRLRNLKMAEEKLLEIIHICDYGL